MPQLVLRFALNDDTGGYDALAAALRRETAATIVYLNEEAIIEPVPGMSPRIEIAITVLVRGEKVAVDSVLGWLDRLVGHKNIDLITNDLAAETVFANGLQARKDGHNEDALEWFDRVLAIDESLGAAWSNRANVLADLERWDQAEASYRRAISCNPADALVRFNLASLLLKLGRLDEAHVELTQATRLDPELEAAKQNLSILEKVLASR